MKRQLLILLLRAQLLVGLLFFVTNSFSQIDSTHWLDLSSENDLVKSLMLVNIDSAFNKSNVLLSHVIEPMDSAIYSTLLMTNAHLLTEKGNYVEANNQYLSVLRIREKLKNNTLLASAYHAMANSHYYMNEYGKVKSYLSKAIANYSLKKENFRNVANCYNLIGLTYYDVADDDSAIYFYNYGIKVLDGNPKSVPEDYQILFENKGNSLKWLGKYDEAIVYLKKNVELYEKNKNLFRLISSYNQLVSYYLKIENVDSAKQYLTLASNIPKEALTVELSKDLYYYKLLVAVQANDLDSVTFYVNEYTDLSDSVMNKKTNQNIKKYQTKYEVEKKEAALKLSQEEKGKLSAESKAKSRLLLLAGAGIIILLLFVLYISRNAKHKAKLSALEVEVKNSELEELLSNQESEVYASILKGQEQERERIAQDLHDRLGGTLAALKLALRKPENHVQEDDLSIIDTAVNEVRSISHNLSTGLVHKYGLNEAVSQLFKTLENSKGIKFSLYLHPEIGKLGQTLGIELYRIVQELVSNTLKHAKADEVSLQTNFSDGIFNLIYEDNGVGFDPKKIEGGIGLENIKSRVKKINGELHIDAEVGRGCIIIVEIKK